MSQAIALVRHGEFKLEDESTRESSKDRTQISPDQIGSGSELCNETKSNHSLRLELTMKISQLRYSPDGAFFCSTGKGDRMVKVWFETRASSFSFIYLKHPAPVTAMEWRRTSKLMPRGSSTNVLLTSCEDNRVRIWVQTMLPDLIILPHFHLAGVVERSGQSSFVAHWVNNKEMQITKSLEAFLQEKLVRLLEDKDSSNQSATHSNETTEPTNDDTLTAESSRKLRHKLCRKLNKQRALAASGRLDTDNKSNSSSSNTNHNNAKTITSPPTSFEEDFDRALENLLREWRATEDIIFSINKTNGDLTSWQIKYLDGDETGAFRPIEIKEYSCLKSALSIIDATTMSSCVTTCSHEGSHPNISMITQHLSGVIGLWKLDLDSGVELVTKITGLPIDPSWLKDGILTVEYDEDNARLLANWTSDENKMISIDGIIPFSGEKDSYRASQLASKIERKEETKLSLTDFSPSQSKLLSRIPIYISMATSPEYEASVVLENESDDTLLEGARIDSLDDPGHRFIDAMCRYNHLVKTLPANESESLKSKGLGSHNLVWAFHSDAHEELVSLIPCVKENKLEWSELREYGVGWWLKKLEIIKKLIEGVAQSVYRTTKDPLDVALYYLAMKKKTLVCALLRRVNCDKRLLKLFEQDFNDPTNRKRALKNAYALLGLHRFEHAAAFFLLAGSIWDAVEVCINNLNDIQLAMILIRLYDSDAIVPNNLRRLLFTEILGAKRPDGRAGNADPSYTYDFSRAHRDPFLRSMAFWRLGDYLASVHTLLERMPDDVRVKASIFNLHRFLKDQPLVVTQKRQADETMSFDESGQRERHLFYSTAEDYLQIGYPLLALEILCSEEYQSRARTERIKFLACLQVILSELIQVSREIESFPDWLDQNLEALRRICPFDGSDEAIKRTMLTYCNLHVGVQECLDRVRLELLSCC